MPEFPMNGKAAFWFEAARCEIAIRPMQNKNPRGVPAI
jgi:hypothetical protein